ncbi:MAG: aminoacyl-tRNA hydrolase [Alphaproteobacteria bacterium]|nr:aminoacyl-tRNA hydrolase [Alphaproteobacteria bacterium]
MQENKPVLVVGLGNPGAEYARTRHNVGFMAVARLAGADAVWKNEKNAKTASVNMAGRRVIFVMPQTYMNLSGNAVLPLMTFYKIPLENLVVIHDDLDLPVGKMREKIGGGSAGHNGIKSIDAAVGNEYRRIRIGIGHPRDLGLPMSPADWVLGKFTDDQMTEILRAIDEIRLF